MHVTYMLGIEKELDNRLVRCTGCHYHDEPAGHGLLKLFRRRNITQVNLMLQPFFFFCGGGVGGGGWGVGVGVGGCVGRRDQ